MQYPLLEQDGRCASIRVESAHGGRWRAFVTLERGPDFARISEHPKQVRVPNTYPSDNSAAQAAYAHARTLIERELACI
jgi:hypothetical protein